MLWDEYCILFWVTEKYISANWRHWRSFNTLRLRWNGCHFADDNIFKDIFLYENVWILTEISLKFVPKGPINNIPALVQIMAWRRPGASHYLNQCWLDYRCIYVSLGLNELIKFCIIVQIWWTFCCPHPKHNDKITTKFCTCTKFVLG